MEKARKLAHKLKQTRFVIVKESKNQLEAFRRLMDKKLDDVERIEFLAFENGFVEGIAGALEKTNQVTLYPVTETALGVAINDEVFETELYR
jgi:hypothetical protein